MTGPGDPTFPYYGQPPPTPPQPPRRPRLGDMARVERRPAPRMGVSFAGVGIVVAVIGVVVWGGDYLAHGLNFSAEGGFTTSDSHRLLGIALSIVVIAVGYLLAVARISAPLTTAGVVASALGVPVLMGFLTFSVTRTSGGPFQIDAVVLVSVAVWLVSYAFVPGARGHAFYLGLATIAFWEYAVDKAEPSALSPVPVITRSIGIQGGVGGPDWGTISLVSFLFGVGYYGAMVALDRAGRAGMATPFALSGFLATVGGIAATVPDLHAKGVGALLIVVGLIVTALGARSSRRFTTWVWAAAVGTGIVILVADIAKNNNAAVGITLIVCGALMVVAGQVWAVALRELPDDVESPVGGTH